MATFGDFEVVDNKNDDQNEIPKEQPGKNIGNKLTDDANSCGRDHSENIQSIGDLDLADFILEDLSFDVCEHKNGSDSGSEFSFIEVPVNQATEIKFSSDDYSRQTTPASSDWSLLECGLTSDSDSDILELTRSSSPCSSTSENEERNESTSLPQQYASSKRGAHKKRRKSKNITDHKLMLQLFGGLSQSVCEGEEDTSLLEVQTHTSSVPTMSNVPSLTDMCMQKIHLYRKSHLIKNFIKSSHFPVGMKETILSSNLQYSVTKCKISWLAQNLSTMEEILEINMKKYPYLKESHSFYCMSSIWKELENVNSVLMNTCFDKDDKENYGHFITVNVQYYMVFATLMTLLLGNARKHIGKDRSYIKRKSRKSKKTSVNEGKSVESLHQFLKSRYPQITKLYFEKSLPYAFWARGNFKGALQAFVDLYKGQSVTDEQKLFIIGEIGRLFAMIYQSEKAIKIYHLLGNCLLQSHPSESDSIETQTQLLITDLQNQGVLTEDKAKNQPVVWNTVFRSCPSNRRDELYMEAADTMLCLHLGNLLGDRTDGCSLDLVRDVLQEYSKHNPKVWYHRALLSALLGQFKASDQCYGEFVKSFRGLDSGDEEDRYKVPGLRMVDLLTARKLSHHNMDALQLAVQNPFEPLLSLCPVRAMKVVWRRQFHHARGSCDNDRGCCGFDLCNPDLNLRMTEDGHITGDCSLVLPPVTSILLNPHTGFLDLDLDGKNLNPWKAFPTEDSRRPHDDWKYLPNVVEIYHKKMKQDEVKAYLTGNCFFKIANCTYWPGHFYEPKTDQVVFAHWNGPNGQRAKFSMVQKIKDFLYKNAVDSVESVSYGPDVEKVKSLLTKWYKQGQPLESMDVGRALNIIKKDKESDKKKKKHNAQLRNKGRLYMKFVDPPQTVGNNVLLTIQIFQDIHYVIIQCKDRDSFVRPIILRPKQRTGVLVTSPRSEYFCVKNTEGKMMIFDCEGKKMQEISQHVNVPFNKMTLIGDNFIFFNKKRLGLMEIQKGATRYFDDFIECDYVGALLDIVILKNNFGIRFADGRQSHLKPMQIRLQGSLQESVLPLKISENGEQLNGNFELVEDLAEDMGKMLGAIAIDNILVLFTIGEPHDSFREVILTKVIEMPGFPTKLKFLHKSVGFLVSWTQHSLNHRVTGYREHLFQYSYSGQLQGVLPFLSRSHSSLCVVYLGEDKEATHTYPSCGHQGWYLYLQDGRQGVMCVRLFQEEE